MTEMNLSGIVRGKGGAGFWRRQFFVTPTRPQIASFGPTPGT